MNVTCVSPCNECCQNEFVLTRIHLYPAAPEHKLGTLTKARPTHNIVVPALFWTLNNHVHLQELLGFIIELCAVELPPDTMQHRFFPSKTDSAGLACLIDPKDHTLSPIFAVLMVCRVAKSMSRRNMIKAFYQIIGPLYLIGAFLATGTTTASDFPRLMELNTPCQVDGCSMVRSRHERTCF